MKRLLIIPFVLILVGYATSGCSSSNSDKAQNDSIATTELESDNIIFTDSFIETIHQFDELFPFSEGFAAVRKGEQFGYINTKGDLVIPCKFSYAGPFNDGLACVIDGEDKPISFIDKKGLLHQTNYPFSSNYYLGYHIKRLANGYIDPEIISFKNGICEIQYTKSESNEITVYIDKELKEVSAPEQNGESTQMANEYEVFYENSTDIYGDEIELKGLKKLTGEILVPAKYNNLRLSDNGVVLATLFIEAADSHLHPYIPYGLQVDGYIDYNGNSTFTESDMGKLEGYKAAQLPIFNNLKLREQEEQARIEAEQEISFHPEIKFNQLLDDIAWQCLGYSLDGESEYIVSFKPKSDTSGYASFVKWAGHNERRSYARSPSYDRYNYVIKGDIIELKSNVTEIDMSFKIIYKDREIVLRSLDYVNNGIFKPTQKRIGLFPQNFDMK